MQHAIRRNVVVGVCLIAAAVFSACGDDSNGGVAPNSTPTPSVTPTAAPTPQPLTSAHVLETGPFGVGVTTMTFVDTSRPTMPNGTYPGAPSRTLVTEIWYPTDVQPRAGTPETRNAPLAHSGAPYPLVIYSHGFMSTRSGGAFLARHLASYGYVVGSPDFPLSNSLAPGGPNFLDLANQPGDVHFLIDQLLALSDASSGPLADSIDRERIGLTGLSMGGSTTFLSAFHPTLRDPRVRAAAPMAGVTCFLGPDFYDHTSIPLLIVHGDIDAVVPYQANGVFAFGEANPPKYLATIIGGSHTGFTDGAEVIFENQNNPDDLGCRALGGPTNDDGGGNFIDLLGGPAAGIIAGDCPQGCTSSRNPHSIRPSRQHQLTILSIFPFFEAYLRGDARARHFLDETLAAENTDVAVQRQWVSN
jgi:predicted dienelactone hydrolase